MDLAKKKRIMILTIMTVVVLLLAIYKIGDYISNKHQVTSVNEKTESSASKDSKEQKIKLNTYFDTNTQYDKFSDVTGKLYINNKDVNVNPITNPTVGPYPTDGSMKMQVKVESPWGRLKSNEILITKEDIHLNILPNSKVQTALMDLINTYNTQWMAAYTENDVSKLTTATEDNKKKVQENINNGINNESYLYGTYLGANFDIDSFSIYYKNGVWRSTLDVEEKYYSGYAQSYGKKPELNNHNHTWNYTLIYNKENKKWLVDQNMQIFNFRSDNIKTVNVKNPKEFSTKWKGTPPKM